MKIKLAENLKNFRKIRGITQIQVAEAMSVTPQAVSRWENGQSYPDITQLPLLAELFNVTLDELLGTGLSPTENLLAELSLAQNRKRAKDNVITRKEVAEICGKLAKLDPVEYATRYLMEAHELNERAYSPDILKDARACCHTALQKAPIERRSRILSVILAHEDEEDFVFWKDYITTDADMATWDDVLLMMHFVKHSPGWEKQRQENVFTSVSKTLLLLSNDVPEIKGRTLYNSLYLYPVNKPEILQSALSLLDIFSRDAADIFLTLRIYIELRYLISVLTYTDENDPPEKTAETALSILEKLNKHFRLLVSQYHGVTAHGSTPATELVERKITYYDLPNIANEIIVNSSRAALDPIRDSKKFREFIRFVSFFDRYLSEFSSTDANQGEDFADLTEYIPMIDKALDHLAELKKDPYSYVNVVLDTEGGIHSIIRTTAEEWPNAEKRWLDEFFKKGLHAKKLFHIWGAGTIDLPSYNFRETLMNSDPESACAEILTLYKKRFVTRKVSDTFPKAVKKRVPMLSQSEFVNAMRQGRGEAVLAAEKYPEKYRSLVLMACKTHFAYDPQCEGNRAHFVYSLIMSYNDRSEFIKTACDSLKEAANPHDIDYFVNLLTYIYKHGVKEAKEAVFDKYEELYGDLCKIDACPSGIFHEFDRFNIGFSSVTGEYEIYRKLAFDVGKLYLKSPFYADGGGFDFDEKEYNEMLANENADSKEIRAFLDTKKKRGAKAIPKQKELSELSGISLSRRLLNESSDVIEKYADIYLSEKDPEKRILALKAFYCCSYPENYSPIPIINDAKSEDSTLRFAALRVLWNVRHQDVREFAFKLIETDPEDAFPILCRNYQPEDSDLFTSLFLRINKHGFDDTVSCHSHHVTVLSMFEKSDDGDSLPTRILPMIYKMTPCSCCRHNAVLLMDKFGILTDDILNECLYDSYDKTQIFAREKLKKE